MEIHAETSKRTSGPFELWLTKRIKWLLQTYLKYVWEILSHHLGARVTGSPRGAPDIDSLVHVAKTLIRTGDKTLPVPTIPQPSSSPKYLTNNRTVIHQQAEYTVGLDTDTTQHRSKPRANETVNAPLHDEIS